MTFVSLSGGESGHDAKNGHYGGDIGNDSQNLRGGCESGHET